MKKNKKTIIGLFGILVLALSFVLPVLPCLTAVASAERAPRQYYSSDYSSRGKLLDAGAELKREVLEEGIVLLKNESNALPLAKNAKISVFGKQANQKSIRDSIISSGLQVNSTLTNFYKDNSQSGDGKICQGDVDRTPPSNGAVTAGLTTGEPAVSMFTDAVKSSFSSYNDAAVVVIFRKSGEGNDASRTMYKTWTDKSAIDGARNADDHYLQLDQNEADLLAMCNSYFDKIIVLLATPSSFETGFLDDPGHYAYQPNIKGAFYLGMPYSCSGVSTIGDVLTGKVDPSGRTVDTWARDFKLDPTWQNFGNYLDEVSGSKGNQYANLPGSGGNGGGGYVNNYVTYNEGIYVGYRYYETRGYTAGTGAYVSPTSGDRMVHGTTTTSWDSWYHSAVVYPYGYGLSYTTFSQEIVQSVPSTGSTISDNASISVKVRVRNTGSVAGKEVVQLYYTAPYTAGGIEKAHVVLAAFDKTKMLEPGEMQDLTLTFNSTDMASYDYSDANANGFKGYELEAGEYTVRLMKNAHEEIGSVSYTVASPGVKISKDKDTGGDVHNRFDEVSDYITGELNQKYLSRNDWEGTWPTFNKRLSASQAVKNGLNEWKVVSGTQQRDPAKDEEEPRYTTVMPTTGASGTLVLADLNRKDYDDPMWEEYLDRFTVEQLTELCTKGYYFSGANYPELGLKRSGNYDSRTGLWAQPSGGNFSGTRVGDIIILAQTWNSELAYRFGRQIGDEALWYRSTGQIDVYGTCGWYAPSINIHRSQFCGRNDQYYGEDPLLAGKLAARVVVGAQEKGLATYVKHFAVNNQETNRCGLMTWVNEQTMREVYFKGFEITVKEGKTLGIMSSLNRLGTKWAGGSYELLTGVLRDEWGFKGCVVTDSYLGDSSNISNADQMIRAGGNLALGNATLKYNVGTPTTVSCLKEMAHGILYMMANTGVINEIEQGYPKVEYSGKALTVGIEGMEYSASVANARLSPVLYPDTPSDGIVYSLEDGSFLPDGLTLSPDGTISGTPLEQAVNLKVYILATYEDYSARAQFTINIVGNNGAIIYPDESDLGTVIVDSPVRINIGGAYIVKPSSEEEEPGELPVVTYRLSDGYTLPDGLTLSPYGMITGRPGMECKNYVFAVTASADGFMSVENVFTINVLYGIKLAGGALPVAKVGSSYVTSLPAAEVQTGTVKYVLAEGSTLPKGLTLTEGGYIVGKPKETVTDHTFTVQAVADFAVTAEAEFTISVGLSYNEVEVLPGNVGEELVLYVDQAQGAATITYTLKSGSLPDGLILEEDGVISGTPQKPGTYEFTVLATADGKLSDERTIVLTIKGDAAEATVQQQSVSPASVALFAVGGVMLLCGAGMCVFMFLMMKKLGLFGNGNGGNNGGSNGGNGGGTAVYDCTASDGGSAVSAPEKDGAASADSENAPDERPDGGGKDADGTDKGEKSDDESDDGDSNGGNGGGEGAAASAGESDKPKKKSSRTKKDPAKKKLTPYKVFGSVFASLFTIIFVITMVLSFNPFLYYTVCSVLGSSKRYLAVKSDNDYTYYSSDYGSKEEVYSAANDFNKSIVEEGIILLKNDSSLPLLTEKNITVFGKNSVNLAVGGSGSNAGSKQKGAIDICDGLTAAGFNCNPVMRDFYNNRAQSGDGRPDTPPAMGDTLTGYPIGETPVTSYTQAVRASYADYHDAAIVVISRIGGEGYDLPRTMFWDGSKYTEWSANTPIPGARSASDHYLQLDANETAMLKEASDNFDNVIVVFNSASPIELGFLDDSTHYAYQPNIKGALWLGHPGTSGAEAIAGVIRGTVNPSGRTVDTFSRNFKNDPVWFNFGNNLGENNHRYANSEKLINAWFVEYREGIYTGYRYYETRGYTEKGINDDWYTKNVVYPFGYGMSYTQFSSSLVSSSKPDGSALAADDTLTFEVEVENTGDRFDGKEVVQLYYSAPYTSGGIEKSQVVLADFAKTDTLAKNGGKQKLTLGLKVRDMASYDYSDANGNGFKGYELDAGEYTVYIGGNAHCWDGGAIELTFTVPEGGFRYANDETTGTAIVNLFDDVSSGISAGNYLSRKDSFANFNSVKGAEREAYRKRSNEFVSSLTYSGDDSGKPWYTEDYPDQSAGTLSYNKTSVKLYDLIGKDYGDELWDALLDQLTVNQMVDLVSTGNFRTLPIENIEKPLTTDADGPMGFAIFMGDASVYDTCFYASECVLAATWNRELAYGMGEMIGNEGLIGDENGDQRPYAGWYAPAMNLHRSQFGGRNFEYYSEDPCISAAMASNVVAGAKTKGVYTYCKHFALNEQETKRDDTGLVTWANEQAMRELYFKPFEACVKEGKTTAMMSSFNRLGPTWTGGSYNLLTRLLRDEWGFNGMVITDFNLKKYMDTDQMIRAGGDINLSARKAPASTSSATDVACLRRATKNILYTVANSCAMNGCGAGNIWKYSLPWWQILLIVLSCVLFCLDGAIWAVMIVKIKKDKKKETNKNEESAI